MRAEIDGAAGSVYISATKTSPSRVVSLSSGPVPRLVVSLSGRQTLRMLGRLRFTQPALIYLNGFNQLICLEEITIDCQIPGSNARNISEPEYLSLRSFPPNLPGSQYSPSLQACCFYLFYQLCLVAYIRILRTPLSEKPASVRGTLNSCRTVQNVLIG